MRAPFLLTAGLLLSLGGCAVYTPPPGAVAYNPSAVYAQPPAYAQPPVYAEQPYYVGPSISLFGGWWGGGRGYGHGYYHHRGW